jgi:multimeric flavodoxin WrbA
VKAFILNGLTEGDDTLYKIIHDELENIGWDVNNFYLQDKKIAPCQGCFGFWVKTPGICLTDDDGRAVVKQAVQSDLMVFLSSISFGGYSSDLKKALDRIIPILYPFFMKINGEIHHKPRYKRYPSLMGVGVLSKSDEKGERIFKTLVARNAINFHSPSNAAGVVVRGCSPEKIKTEVKTLFEKIGENK